MDYARFKEWRWRALLGILNAGLALIVIFLPYISVSGEGYYIYDLPGGWWHGGVFVLAAILAAVSIKSFSYDFILPIFAAIGAAIDLTFTLGVVFLGVSPDITLVTASTHVGAIVSVGLLILLLIQGYIWLQLRSEDLDREKLAIQEPNAAAFKQPP